METTVTMRRICGAERRFSAMKSPRGVALLLYKALMFYYTKVRRMHGMHAAQTPWIHKLTTQPGKWVCKRKPGHSGPHGVEAAWWEGNRSFLSGAKAFEMAFGRPPGEFKDE